MTVYITFLFIILLLVAVILLVIYKYFLRRRTTKMFELFDQNGQDLNSDVLSSYEDSTGGNIDLINNGGSLTQDTGTTGVSDLPLNPYSPLETGDVTQTSPTTPAPNPFDIDNPQGANVNSNAQGETEKNPFNIFDKDSSNQPAEDIDPYKTDTVSDTGANDDLTNSDPYLPDNQTAVDDSSAEELPSTFDDVKEQQSVNDDTLEQPPINNEDILEQTSIPDDSTDMNTSDLENQPIAEDAPVNAEEAFESFPHVDSGVTYNQTSVYDDTFYFPSDPYSDIPIDDSPIVIDDWSSMIPDEYQDYIPSSFEDWVSDVWTFFFGDAASFHPADSLVSQDQFTQLPDGGEFDSKNGLIVDGNVQQDIDYLSKQTHSSCSLMAQEQFVERYMGESVSESLLENLMSSHGVYDPQSGTTYEGQTMVLDAFNIPYERNSFASMDDLVNELDSNHDCIVVVDARDFYNDPCIPPDSGHAVTVVGKGIDPDSNEIKGFYITDSNFPGSAHFIETSKLSNAWYNDIISIPNPEIVA